MIPRAEGRIRVGGEEGGRQAAQRPAGGRSPGVVLATGLFAGRSLGWAGTTSPGVGKGGSETGLEGRREGGWARAFWEEGKEEKNEILRNKAKKGFRISNLNLAFGFRARSGGSCRTRHRQQDYRIMFSRKPRLPDLRTPTELPSPSPEGLGYTRDAATAGWTSRI